MFEKICKIARNAGTYIMQIYNSDTLLHINYKSDKSPVTNADNISHQIIKNGLFSISPNIPVLSEEDCKNIDFHKNWSIYWLIDPLDGTKDFLKKNGEFTVNISLIDNGIPVLGVIYAPFFNILYGSIENKAWKINAYGYKKNISIKSSSTPQFVISRSHPSNKLYKFLDNIKNYTIKKLGSSLKFCYVAEGKAQFYPRFGSTYIWDTAAGHAIVSAAGGKVIAYDNKIDLNYSLLSKSSLKNPEFLVLSSFFNFYT